MTCANTQLIRTGPRALGDRRLALLGLEYRRNGRRPTRKPSAPFDFAFHVCGRLSAEIISPDVDRNPELFQWFAMVTTVGFRR